MDNDTQFLDGVFAKGGKYDFIVAELNINCEQFKQFLNQNSDYIKQNKGFIKIEVLRTKKDREKMYCKFTPFTPKPQVQASEHMPDRQRQKEDDEVPF